ncbi:MAG: hypothetical protein P9F75_18875 [Candidatus Contendobacter sp.]|nr:hypothetical protein [Candidatus Contendobacter sp.]
MKSVDLDASHNEALPDVALIQTALCYLMTRYTLRPCSGLNFTIVHHLQMLLAHPDVARLPERRKIHRELLQQWRSIVLQQEAAGLDSLLSRQTALN